MREPNPRFLKDTPSELRRSGFGIWCHERLHSIEIIRSLHQGVLTFSGTVFQSDSGIGGWGLI